MKVIKFGASLGYPAGIESYKGVLDYWRNHGLNYFRIYEPFAKGIDTDLNKLISKINYLVYYNTAEVLLSLSNIPYSWLSDYDLTTLSPTQLKDSGHTNRFFPVRIQEYKDLLTTLCDKLYQNNLLNKISFQLSNEVNASKYFWGDLNQLIQLDDIKYNILKDYNRPIYSGSCSSAVLRDKTYKDNTTYHDYINNNSFTSFSHSFYHNDLGGEFDFNNNTYLTKEYNNILISEYSMYSSFKRDSIQEQNFNSSNYLIKLTQLLKFIYDKPVTHLLVHPLCQYGQDERGKMGLYQKKYQGTGELYTITKACEYFFEVYNVIKNGYEIVNNNIRGTQKTIIIDNSNNYTIVYN